MNSAVLLEYTWMLLVLVVLEGILAADNACVMAVMIKHLPEKARSKALFYGLAGALIFRFASLFAISMLVDMWQVQALGAAYLLFLSINHLLKSYLSRNQTLASDGKCSTLPAKGDGFWMTVLKVEIADIAFAADSILAAIALALTLPSTDLPTIGGLDGGKFMVVFFGGFIGVIMMRFAAQAFCKLLVKRPGLENAAYTIVGWVGVKLAVYTLSHPEIAILTEGFAESTLWKVTFWAVFIGICLIGWFASCNSNNINGKSSHLKTKTQV